MCVIYDDGFLRYCYAFVPQVYMRHLSDHYKLKRVVGYIASHWPYMNHTGGMSKHIVIHGGEQMVLCIALCLHT